MTLAPATRLGPYEIVAPLGAGGMGEVYRARDPRLGREVAIKVLPAEVANDSERLRRFEQEARAASALNHPNLLTLFDVGRHDETSYLVTELLEGRSFRELLTSGETIATKRALEWGAQVARGLAAAHEKGIVHRDLKPENLFLTQGGVVKILDFGLAKLTASVESELGQATTIAGAATGTGVILGTAGYMAPEQVRGERVDARADLFALGCVLYELLGGRRAFRGDTAIETLNAILKEEPPALGSLRAELPLDVAHLVERCLAKRAAERWQSARDLAFRLEEFASGGSGVLVRPGPPTATSPAAAESARRLLPWAIAAVALALAGVVLYRTSRRPAHPAPIVWQRVSFRKGTPNQARFAPDGKTILFANRLDGGAGRALFTTRLDSPESTPLALPSSLLYAVSPEGQVALGLNPESTPTLGVAALAGGGVRELAKGITAADFSPDGSRLAVIHKLADRYVLELPVGTVLFDPGPRVELSGVRFSPAGDRLAFVEARAVMGVAEEDSLVEVDLAGRRTLLSPGWGGIYGIAWHPESSEVWFTAQSVEHPGGLELYAIHEPGPARLVTTSPGLVRIQDFLPDGRALLLHSDWSTRMICRAPASTQESDLTWLDYSALRDLSDDGRSALLSETGIAGGGRGIAFLRPTDGGDAVRLGDGEAIALSPDAKWAILATSTAPRTYSLVPTGPGAVQALEIPDREIRMVSFIPGSRELLFATRQKEEPAELDAVVPGATARRHIATGNFWIGPISPDGQTLVVGNGKDAYELLALDGSGARRPLPELDGDLDEPLRFDREGGALFVARGELPVEVSRFDLATRRRTALYQLGSGLAAGVRGINPVRLSADGSSYCYSYFHDTSELYVVTGLE